MVTAKRARGDAAEDQALQYLQDAGLQVIGRNVASPLGEIDLVMRDGAQWVFVEVRSRASGGFGGAAASVTSTKQRRLRRQAQAILKAQFGDSRWPACRFDVCAFDAGQINWIRDAF